MPQGDTNIETKNLTSLGLVLGLFSISCTGLHSLKADMFGGRRHAAVLAAGLVIAVTWPQNATAQRRPRRPRAKPRALQTATAPNHVTISYPDSVDLSAFVDYVSQSLNVKIIYGDEVRNQTVVFRPGEVEVPKSQLLDLLRSMLRMRDLALVEGDVDGWLRIVQATDMQRHVKAIRFDESAASASNRVVTQVVRIASADMAPVIKHARSFLSSSKASVIEVPDKKLIIITDYESAVAKALEIIELVDVDRGGVEVVSVPVVHYDAAAMTDRIGKVLADKAQMEGIQTPPVTLQPDSDAGSILLVGPVAELESVRALIAQFDTPPDLHRSTVAYSPKHMTAARLRGLVDHLMVRDSQKQGILESYLDDQTNRLYITTSPEVHEQIRALLETEDQSSIEPSRPLRIYKPKNRMARELIGILSEVLPDVTAAVREERERPQSQGNGPAKTADRIPPIEATKDDTMTPDASRAADRLRGGARRVTRVEGKDFTLSYDEHTNSLIAIGTREFHAKLKTLMAELDRRQPQVLIEMTLVAVTFNDSLSFAMELAEDGEHSRYQTLLFSSFGLSDIDLSTGARTFNPGGGFNALILGPNETPLLMRAIAAHGNSRIITTPKVIVSDNTTASIGSVEEAPFTSINASETVATTSFAGFESAGTTLTVTPHIAQGDHMSLDYSFNFSNFTGGGSVGVPPPRTTNTFSGSVEIPDGYTIIVGGLVTENETDSVTEVPLVGRIPIIGVLFQSSDRARTKSRIFAFIKATILRDDRFADLKLISQGEIDRAALKNQDFPESQYLWMR